VPLPRPVGIHAAIALLINYHVAPLSLGKHLVKIGVTCNTVGITVIFCFRGEGRICQVVILVIEIDIVNARHGVDDIECSVERALVVLKH